MARAILYLWLPVRERKQRTALQTTFETVKNYAMAHEGGRFKGLSVLYNIGLYLLIADRDIQAAKIDALTHPDEWKRKLGARIILLTIYEWDADKVAGRALREALDLMLIPDDLKVEATAVLRRLRAIQEKATKQFSFIRNTAIAHRDPSALVQYRAIRDLDVEQVIGLAAEFYQAVGHFISLLTKLMDAANSLPSMLNQWSATNSARVP